MDCRNTRLLMANAASLTPAQQQALQSHLASCAACRDDLADPFGRVLWQTTFELATPSADVTATLLQRLPRESPIDLWSKERAQRRTRWRRALLAGALMLVGLTFLGLLQRGLWRGTTLGLLTDGITLVMGESLAPLAVMLGSAAAVIWLLRLLIQRPTALSALGSVALATLLLMISATAVALNDRGNLARSTGPAVATVARPIEVAAAQGPVASLLGDIIVRGPVAGSVVTVAGRARLEPTARVAGDVLAGAAIEGEGQVAGKIRQSMGGAALGAAMLGGDVATVSPLVLRALAGLAGALLSLALAALLLLWWPQRTLAISRSLPERPWAAFGIGVLLTIALALLALPLLAVLAATVVGLILVPVLLLLLHGVYVQGLAAVGQALGQRVTGAATTASALWGVAAQLVVVLLLSLYAPLAGLTAFYLLASLGLGAQLLQWRDDWQRTQAAGARRWMMNNKQ